MTKRKTKGRAFTNKGYNHDTLWPQFPELAASFLAVMLQKRDNSVTYVKLLDHYLGKIPAKKDGSLRAVPMERILLEVQSAGYEVEIKIKHKGRAIGDEMPACPWDKKRVATICLGGRAWATKNANIGKKMFDKDVYLVEEFYYSVVTKNEEWPMMIRPKLLNIDWKVVPTVFDYYGYLLLKARVSPDHLLGLRKQRIVGSLSQS